MCDSLLVGAEELRHHLFRIVPVDEELPHDQCRYEPPADEIRHCERVHVVGFGRPQFEPTGADRAAPDAFLSPAGGVSGVREDRLAERIVRWAEATTEPTVSLEEPYDHYGNRGQVDVYLEVPPPPPREHVIELKGDAAVRRATGANEILRQFRRAVRYFYRDETHHLRRRLGRTEPPVRFLLAFAPTVACVEHVARHATLYESVEASGPVEGVESTRRVAFLVGVDGDPEELRTISINEATGFGSEAFRDAIPAESRLAEAMETAD